MEQEDWFIKRCFSQTTFPSLENICLEVDEQELLSDSLPEVTWKRKPRKSLKSLVVSALCRKSEVLLLLYQSSFPEFGLSSVFHSISKAQKRNRYVCSVALIWSKNKRRDTGSSRQDTEGIWEEKKY